MEGQANKQIEEAIGNANSVVGQLAGFSVSSLIQMLQNDSQTTVVEVKGTGLQNGTIYFHNGENGEVVDASCGSLKGDEAALEMIGWDWLAPAAASISLLASPILTPP